MRSEVRKGNLLQFIAGSDLVSGAVAVFGNLIGVVMGSVSNGGTGTAQIEGVFSLPKYQPAAWTQGQAVYWDSTAQLLTLVAAGNTYAGRAAAAAQSTDTTGEVKLNEGYPQGVFVASVSTANATDLASSEALTNANKTTLNAVIASLQNAGLLASS